MLQRRGDPTGRVEHIGAENHIVAVGFEALRDRRPFQIQDPSRQEWAAGAVDTFAMLDEAGRNICIVVRNIVTIRFQCSQHRAAGPTSARANLQDTYHSVAILRQARRNSTTNGGSGKVVKVIGPTAPLIDWFHQRHASSRKHHFTSLRSAAHDIDQAVCAMFQERDVRRQVGCHGQHPRARFDGIGGLWRGRVQ